MTQLNQKLDIPFNWERLLVFSVATIASIFVVGGLFKIRLLLALGEVAAVATLILSLTIFFISVVRKYAVKPTDSK